MRICTNCRRAYSRDNTFCPYCGMTHHTLGRVCHRGHSNPWNALFCATCGSQELSQMAQPPPIWRRLLMAAVIIGGLVLAVWFLASAAMPHGSRLMSGLYTRFMDMLFPAMVCIFLFFGFTLFLPKHMGKYLRKVFFSFVRYSFRLAATAFTLLWRVLAYLAASLLGRRGPNARRQYRQYR